MILITGAAGYIGSHIYHELKKKKIKVIGIDNFSTNNVKNIYSKKILKVDINNNSKIKKIFNKYKIETVVHAAAFSHPLESLKFPKKYKKNNIDKTINFISNCTKNNIKNFIFFSSSNVYTEKIEGPYKENNPTKPKNYYGKTKIFIEKVLKKNNKSFKNLIILRLFNVVGYYHDFKYYENKYNFKRIFNIFQNELKKTKFLKLHYYTVNNRIEFPERDFVHIKDLNKLIIKMLSNFKKSTNYKIYNVGSGKPTNIKKLIKIYQKYKKIKIKYILKKINIIELKSIFADIKKVKRDYSWSPNNTLKTIIKSYI